MRKIIILLILLGFCSCSLKKDLVISQDENKILKEQVVKLKEINKRLIDLLDECEAERK